MQRPSFIEALLDRPLPPLTPLHLSDKSNPPYSVDIRNQIADLQCHPLLEASLHLLNDDLFSAHFLLRKMQEDEWGKWLHAILHQAGDLEKNAKLWYRQVDSAVLGLYWAKHNASDPTAVAIDNMFRIMRVKEGKSEQDEERTARTIKWEELVHVMKLLEDRLGWAKQDGTGAYTRDESESHKSMVLGEGYRAFDKAGRRR